MKRLMVMMLIGTMSASLVPVTGIAAETGDAAVAVTAENQTASEESADDTAGQSEEQTGSGDKSADKSGAGSESADQTTVNQEKAGQKDSDQKEVPETDGQNKAGTKKTAQKKDSQETDDSHAENQESGGGSVTDEVGTDDSVQNTEDQISSDQQAVEVGESTEEDLADTDVPQGFSDELADIDVVATISEATSGSCGEHATWNISGGVLTISGSGAIADYTYGETPWFGNRSTITSVVISSGITRIGTWAFVDCGNMTGISIPGTVTELGKGAFAMCGSLQKVTLPNGVKTIPYAAFGDCYSLTEVSMPGVTAIEDYAFQNANVKELVFGKQLKDLSEYALFCTRIASYRVESGNTAFSAKDGVLFNAAGNTLISYPAGNERASYTIPSGVKKIGQTAFSGNQYLKSLVIPEGVTELGESACQGMEALESVKLPNSVTTVGDFTFYECTALKSVVFGTGLKTTSYQMFESCSALENISFGGLQEIYARTFAYCDSLKAVSLPVSVVSVGNGAFGECTSLQSFSASALKSIPYQTFLNDSSLSDVRLAEGLTEVCRESFIGCSSLKEITLPASVTFVDADAFPEDTVIHMLNQSLSKYGKNGYRELGSVSLSGTRYYDQAYSVLNLLNAERRKNGLAELKMESSLLETAMVRAVETVVLFSHTRPDGTLCFTLNSLMSAENIASGQKTPEAVMKSWMNSAGHKANILNESMHSVGIGCVKINGVYYWVQCFGREDTAQNCAKPANKKTTQKVALAVGTFQDASVSGGIVWGDVEEFVYSIYISGGQNMQVGDELNLTAYLTNPGMYQELELKGENVTYSSSNPKVAKVTSDGKVTALKKGTVKITASAADGKYTDTITIKVTEGAKNVIKASDLTLTKSAKAQTKNLNASNSKKLKMTYRSDNKKVKVSKTGKITVAKNFVGIAKITISTPKSGKIQAAKKVVTITVRPVTPSVKLKKKGAGSVKVSWKKIKKTSGYQVQYASKKNMKGAKSLTVKSKSKGTTLKRPKGKKKLYVRVRSWEKVNGKKIYSKWSKVKGI